MPRFYLRKWNNLTIETQCSAGDIRGLRNYIWLFKLLPFFWDTEIFLDLWIVSSKPAKIDNYLDLHYSWRLLDLDGNEVKKGEDFIAPTIKQRPFPIDEYLNAYKKRAFNLGNLNPNRYYLLYATFNNNKEESKPLLLTTFTVKDREEIYLQLLIGLILIIATIFLTRMGG